MWSLVPPGLRVYVILGLAAGLLAAGAWVGYRLGSGKADRERAAALTEALKERDRVLAERDLAFSADSRAALAMAAVREDLAKHAGAIQASIDSEPLVREVIREVNGQKFSCIERDAAAYRRVYNAAIDGTDPAATGPGDVPGTVPRQ